MTRRARRCLGAIEKKPHQGSSWEELSSANQTKSHHKSSGSGGIEKHRLNKQVSMEAAAENFLKQRAQEGKIKSKAANAEKEMMIDYMRRDRKREKRRLKRIGTKETNMVCFKCRQTGHDMATCPKVDMTEEGSGICFKCGSTEHSLNQCRMKGEMLAYAKCFICKENGHLAKQCPDNPRGLYPNGGCCRECGSVEHYRKDCPELQQRLADEDVTVERLDPLESADAEVDGNKSRNLQKRSGPKIVNF